jgi:hypothetical protein
MSETFEVARHRVLGGFAVAFLMAAGYSKRAVLKMGDLTDVPPERIHELLAAKVAERKKTVDWAKRRRLKLGVGAQKKLKQARKGQKK